MNQSMRVLALLWGGSLLSACGASKPCSEPQVITKVVAPPGGGEPKEASAKMDLNRLAMILGQLDPDVERNDNAFRLTVGEVEVLCFTDPLHDRMRFIVPITPVDKITEEQMKIAMAANFHTALDARYATSDGLLFAAYIHPLSPLTEQQVHSALRQTVTLALTFGTHYTAGELIFGGEEESHEDETLM